MHDLWKAERPHAEILISACVGIHRWMLAPLTLIIRNRNMKKLSFSEDLCSMRFGWIRCINLKPVLIQIHMLQSMRSDITFIKQIFIQHINV